MRVNGILLLKFSPSVLFCHTCVQSLSEKLSKKIKSDLKPEFMSKHL